MADLHVSNSSDDNRESLDIGLKKKKLITNKENNNGPVA
jgi:hypothetical protein